MSDQINNLMLYGPQQQNMMNYENNKNISMHDNDFTDMFGNNQNRMGRLDQLHKNTPINQMYH